RRVTRTATKDKDGDFDPGERSCRKRKAVCTFPIEDVNGRRLDGVGTNSWRPGFEGARTAIKVDHCCNRLNLPVRVRSKIGARHLTKSAILPILSLLPEQVRERSFYDHETGQAHLVAERHAERHQATERMTDQMDATTGLSNHRFQDIGLVGNGSIASGAPFGGPAVTKQACCHAAELAVPA